MILAPIVPPGCEHLLPYTERVMAFADIAASNSAYLKFYAARQGVILDNQIYEGRIGLSSLVMADVVQAINPCLVIVPDVRGKAEATAFRAQQHLPRLLRLGVNLAGVVQGRTIDECIKSMDFWATQDVGYIAVPIRHPSWEATRAEVYRFVVRPRLEGRRVHFLGIEAWPYFEEADLADEVESIDTAEPTSVTIWGGDFVKRPPEFMTAQIYKDILAARKDLLWKNIETATALLATRPAYKASATLTAESSLSE